MGDPFTLVVSAAGLASFGIQLLQGLNKYAGSALESRDRIRAISTDIEPAVQVVQALDATIKDDANRALVNDDAERLAQEAQNQCWDIFTKIRDKLPKYSANPGSRKRDIFTWPFKEPNLELLRGNLEKVKTTLQLLMNVIILAAMTKRQAEQALLDQQRQQIEQLLEQKAAAEARLEVLEHDHAQALLAGSCAPTSSGHARVESSPVIDLVMVEQPPSLEVSLRDLAATMQVDPFQVLTSNNALVSGCSSISDNRCSSRVHTSSESNSLEHSQRRVESTPLLVNGEELPRDDLELASLMAELHNDYTSCLEQIKALQEKLETALGGMFVPGISAPAVNFKLAADDRRNIARTVDLCVWETYKCLDKCISKTGAHSRIIEEPLSKDKASLFDTVTRRRTYHESPEEAMELKKVSRAGYNPPRTLEPPPVPMSRTSTSLWLPRIDPLLWPNMRRDSGIKGGMKLNSVLNTTKFPSDAPDTVMPYNVPQHPPPIHHDMSSSAPTPQYTQNLYVPASRIESENGSERGLSPHCLSPVDPDMSPSASTKQYSQKCKSAHAASGQSRKATENSKVYPQAASFADGIITRRSPPIDLVEDLLNKWTHLNSENGSAKRRFTGQEDDGRAARRIRIN
ncbi:hypothetical protein KCU95_g1973, partial [Aureobasidium melanogenum]